MDNEEEFQGILKGITSKDLRDLLDSVPVDEETAREDLPLESDTLSSNLWGSSGSLKYRRDY